MILLPNYHQVTAMIARRRAIVKLLDNKFQMHVSATKIFLPSDSIGAAEDVEFQRVVGNEKSPRFLGGSCCLRFRYQL